MALGDLTEKQAQILRLMRDSRPCRITKRELHTWFSVLKHMARMGWVDLRGDKFGWSATITGDGVKRLHEHHMKASTQHQSPAEKGGPPHPPPRED